MPRKIDYERLPTAHDVEETLLPEPEQMYGWRNLFRVDSQASSRDSDSVEYPALDEDFDGDFVEIHPGDPHPQAELTYDGLVASWTEYGFKFVIEDTDIADSKIGVVMVNQQEQTKAKMQSLDGIAGAHVEANRSDTVIGDDATDINYAAMTQAEAALMDAGWELSRFAIAVSPQTWATFAQTEEFTSDTDRFADELRAEGIQLGELLGHPVLRMNTGPFAGGVDNLAYMVDTGAYGWESPRREFSAEQGDRDADERQTPYFINGRIDWVPTNPTACIRVEGGA
jgi:hypothetical protein